MKNLDNDATDILSPCLTNSTRAEYVASLFDLGRVYGTTAVGLHVQVIGLSVYQGMAVVQIRSGKTEGWISLNDIDRLMCVPTLDDA